MLLYNAMLLVAIIVTALTIANIIFDLYLNIKVPFYIYVLHAFCMVVAWMNFISL